jgi:SWI/SNF-related matrix-associated actin-dependent regulator 1 of chromatin subfamily A
MNSSQIDTLLSKLIVEKSGHIAELKSAFKSRLVAEQAILDSYIKSLTSVPNAVELKVVESKKRKRKQSKKRKRKKNKRSVEMKLDLYEHQQKALAFSKKAKRCLLAMEVGTGKTAIVIQAIVDARRANRKSTALIVVPASLKNQWLAEIKKFSTLKQSSDYLITSYSSLKKVKGQFNIVVGDEAHYVKNAYAKRSKCFVAKCKSAKMVILLSGTPTESHDAMFNLLHILRPRRFRNLSWFRSKFCIMRQVSIGRGKTAMCFARNKNAKGLIAECIDCVLHMGAEDVCSSLPPIVERIHSVGLDQKIEEESDDDWEPEHVKPKWMEHWRDECAMKVGPAIAFLKQYERYRLLSGEKLCVFTFHKTAANDIYVALGSEKQCCLFTGDTDRSQALKKFQNDPAKRIAILTMSSSGTGLNLQFANHLVFAELSPDSVLMTQARGRICRIGQKKPMWITLLRGGKMDNSILKKLNRKKECALTILTSCK